MPLESDIIHSLLPTGSQEGLTEQKDFEIWISRCPYLPSGNISSTPNIVGLDIGVAVITAGDTTIDLTPDADITLYKNQVLRLANEAVLVVKENTTLDATVLGTVPIYTYEGADYNSTGSDASILNTYPMMPIGMVNGGGPAVPSMTYATTNNADFGLRTISVTNRKEREVSFTGQVNKGDPAYPLFQEMKNANYYKILTYLYFKEKWRFSNDYEGVTYYGGQAGNSEYYNGYFNVAFENSTDEFMTYTFSGSANDHGLLLLPEATD